MRFLIDPGTVHLDAAAIAFLILICGVMPAAALRQHAQHGRGIALPDRGRIYVGVILTHAILLVVVILLARHLRLSLRLSDGIGVADLGIGAAALAIGLVPLLPQFRLANPVGEERAKLIAPRTPRDYALFYALCVSAGVSEELTYRGTLFTLLTPIARSWWIAAVVAAMVFGIVHLFQGWRSAGVAALMGLLAQIVVGMTGTLIVAMAVHTLHDAIAGTTISLRARRESATA